MKRFVAVYENTKEILGDEAEALPSDMLAFSVMKCVFQENPEFGRRCGAKTVSLHDIHRVVGVLGANPFFEKIVNCCAADPTMHEAMLTNLSDMAKVFGYGG
jgi:uncharacterized Fe-S radical SAM superfamily protein PflX